jgi:hypothetical protein
VKLASAERVRSQIGSTKPERFAPVVTPIFRIRPCDVSIDLGPCSHLRDLDLPVAMLVGHDPGRGDGGPTSSNHILSLPHTMGPSS